MTKLADFDYHLPPELIAQFPLTRRDQARLLVVERSTGCIRHRIFKDIVEYFRKGDLLVTNDTKVVPCRLIGRRPTGGKVEVFLLRHKQGGRFGAMISPGRVKTGEKIVFPGSRLSCVRTDREEVEFNTKSQDRIYRAGRVPLPPYIKRRPRKLDAVYYQTVYAREKGSVASPTAGLHFTRPLLSRIRKTGVRISPVTLHVGLATFKPVTVDEIEEHPMGKEYFTVPAKTVGQIKTARAGGGRIICTGTTSCRALESYAGGITQGWTNLFMYPGYQFRLVDCLLTNFHLPRTTLFMLVCAFAGTALAKKAYAAAIEEKYRFYSYGDAMLII
ncbi:MAG: tRNA preQ1(34) S-adenosylmethionine ribosyltransferase-isomerase QueA [Candidatus Omnitrophica bacterium]|nr:tRNA preQ1(34) S-adenosylmethionine ribosyltransferase-isomerase QueA [Candidatus Omnitrophota bacterium]